MKFYTKKWDEYIYKNCYKNICNDGYNIYQRYVIYKDNFKCELPEYLKDTSKYAIYQNEEDYKKQLEKAIEKEEKIVYTEELVKQEFDKYYQSKKDYINTYPKLKEMFGNFEKVELLSYEEELERYKQRIEKYAKRLKDEIPSLIDRFHIIEENKEEDFLSLQDSYFLKEAKEFFAKNTSLDDIDYRIIAMHQASHKYCFLYQNLNITNEVNGFLTGYKNYLKKRTDKFDYEFLESVMFHDGNIEEIKFTEENGKTNGHIVFTDDYGNNLKYTIKFYNVQIIGDNLENYRYIGDYDYGNYEDYNYYLQLDEYEFIADKIEIIKSNVNDVLAKYDRLKEDYRENIKSLENKIDKRLYEKLKKRFAYDKLATYDYTNNNLTMTISESKTNRYNLILENARIKYYHNQLEITKDEAIDILNHCDEELRKVYTKFIKEQKEKSTNIDKSIFERSIELRIDEIDNQYEVGILALTSEKYGDVEVIIKCTNIKYIEE